MSRCKFCDAEVERLDLHYGRECEPLRVALDPDYWPFKVEADDKPTKRGGALVRLPVVNGVKQCRCGRGPTKFGSDCADCHRERVNRYRRQQRQQRAQA